MSRHQAYYARCQSLYGTRQELRDREIIAQMGYYVIDFPPQSQIDLQKDAGKNVMETIFLPLVEKAHMLFFRAMPCGSIPAGVWMEVQHAISTGKVVLELPNFGLRRKLTVEETRALMRDMGQR